MCSGPFAVLWDIALDCCALGCLQRVACRQGSLSCQLKRPVRWGSGNAGKLNLAKSNSTTKHLAGML